MKPHTPGIIGTRGKGFRATAMLVFSSSVACAPGDSENRNTGPDTDGLAVCTRHEDCADGQWCLHGRCSPTPTAGASDVDAVIDSLTATPVGLNFGGVSPGAKRTLSVIVSNDGAGPLILDSIHAVPASAPFQVEPLGYGPFWIRPDQSRPIFVTFVPESQEHVAASLEILSRRGGRATVDLSGN